MRVDAFEDVLARAVPAGAPLMVHLESAKGPAPWESIGLILVQGQDTRENMDQLPGAPDAAGAVQLPALPPGAGAVGLDLRPAVETLDAGALRAFTIAKCARQLPEDVTGKVRVRRLQSCKALVRVGDAPGNAAAALNETSQRAEIATRMDPTRATIGSDIAFAISIDGTDVEDERVIATCIATGREQEVESREGGAGSFRITAAGPWRVEFHRLERAGAGSDADWVLTSATLTFDVPATKPEARP